MDIDKRLVESVSMSQITIREATITDAAAIQAVLEQNGLHTAGILTSGSRYWVAEDLATKIIGCIGLEYGPRAVLLRSAAVRPDLHGQGIGSQLFAHVYAMAAVDHIPTVYLFSTDAGDYWVRQGFCEVPVAELCAALLDSFQVHDYREMGWLPTEVAWRREIV